MSGILLTSDLAYHELRTFLEQDGHRVDLCPLKDTPTWIEQGNMEVVVLDWGDRARDGLALLRRLKVGRPEIPVVVLAGESSEETAIEAFRFGAKDYFRKPVNIPEVLEVLRNIIRLRKTARERRFPYLTREGVVSSLLVNATSTMSPCILRALTFMADNFPDQLTLDTLAEEAGMSKYHLCRSFKKAMGMSPIQFLTAIRIERSKKLIGETSLNVGMIALEVGFGDSGSFISHFKKITGTTPSAFRKNLLKSKSSNNQQKFSK